ncbi:hypothetical protein DFQ04_0699 [Algoriphagus boseongensis]|uniref:Outer membrane protein with beta-barrel domain n=1 Tax=Algoriphagus boseongensis TaxID=1442587 RepID=A0A4R6T6V5_9BACT|nr:hypothetical protein [Algoriphagus boseongensis]TDQ18888.1 hypothetical protein DFQ04_0699 [Algoriphagus boseongensis]
MVHKKLKYLAPLMGLILLIFPKVSSAQTQIDLGLRSQKAFGLYFENGPVAKFSFERFAPERLALGIGYTTSRLGSAIGSNAIRQDNYQLWLAYYLKKEHKLRPVFSLGTGYFNADYESNDFEVLDHGSPLLYATAGLEYATAIPLKINLSLGYNFISGNGDKGPGTLYPTFAQLNFFYPLK